MKKFILKYSEKPKNLFKSIFFTFLFGYAPLGLLHIILNLAGIIPVNFNEKEVYGLTGFLVIIIFTPFVILMFSSFIWLYFIVGNLIIKIIKKVFYE